MSILTDVIGYLAATVGTLIMLPQVIRSIRTKHANDVSMVMLIAYIVNCVLWDIYGILLHSLPLILCNSIALVIGSIQMYLKIKYSRQSAS